MFPVQLLYIDKISLVATTFCNHGFLSSKIYKMKKEMAAALHVIAWYSAGVGRCRIFSFEEVKTHMSYLLMQQLISRLLAIYGGSVCHPPLGSCHKA